MGRELHPVGEDLVEDVLVAARGGRPGVPGSARLDPTHHVLDLGRGPEPGRDLAALHRLARELGGLGPRITVGTDPGRYLAVVAPCNGTLRRGTGRTTTDVGDLADPAPHGT